MSHETPTIEATLRDHTGSRYAQRLRSQGRLPAVIYGHKTDPVHISVDEKEMLTYLHHGSHVFNVTIPSGTDETCLVKELQFGYLGDNIIHIDLARVNLDEEVTVNVRLRFHGVPNEGKQTGAIVNHDRTEVEVRCKVTDIPEEIKADLARVESTFTIGDIELPPGVTATQDAGTLVAHVTFVKREEEVVTGEEAEVVAEDQSEPEVISEGKPEDDEKKAKD